MLQHLGDEVPRPLTEYTANKIYRPPLREILDPPWTHFFSESTVVDVFSF